MKLFSIERAPKRRLPEVFPAYSRVPYNQYVVPQNFAYHYLIPAYPAALVVELLPRNESPFQKRENAFIRLSDILQNPETVQMMRRMILGEEGKNLVPSFITGAAGNRILNVNLELFVMHSVDQEN